MREWKAASNCARWFKLYKQQQQPQQQPLIYFYFFTHGLSLFSLFLFYLFGIFRILFQLNWWLRWILLGFLSINECFTWLTNNEICRFDDRSNYSIEGRDSHSKFNLIPKHIKWSSRWTMSFQYDVIFVWSHWIVSQVTTVTQIYKYKKSFINAWFGILCARVTRVRPSSSQWTFKHSQKLRRLVQTWFLHTCAFSETQPVHIVHDDKLLTCMNAIAKLHRCRDSQTLCSCYIRYVFVGVLRMFFVVHLLKRHTRICCSYDENRSQCVTQKTDMRGHSKAYLWIEVIFKSRIQVNG